jgi:hypothetical protein
MLVFWVVMPCELAGRDTSVLEKHTVSIFTPEDGGNMNL